MHRLTSTLVKFLPVWDTVHLLRGWKTSICQISKQLSTKTRQQACKTLTHSSLSNESDRISTNSTTTLRSDRAANPLSKVSTKAAFLKQTLCLFSSPNDRSQLRSKKSQKRESECFHGVKTRRSQPTQFMSLRRTIKAKGMHSQTHEARALKQVTLQRILLKQEKLLQKDRRVVMKKMEENDRGQQRM